MKEESEEERQLRLKEKVDVWFFNLDSSYQFELLEPYYPDKAYLMDISEMWNGLDWNDKWDIYTDARDEVLDV